MTVTPPVRARHTYTQRLLAPPERVFPLLCPVREAEWVPGWAPRLVVSTSGVAEPSCVFVTPDDGAEAVWVVTEHDPARYRVGFVKVTPGRTVGQIAIALHPGPGPDETEAEVTYQFTALSAEGEAAVAAFTAEHYLAFMQEWEAALNHYLRTAERLDG